MSKQGVLNQVYGVLVEIREGHPHGLRGIGSGNCHEVLTRFGIDGQIAVACGLIFEFLEEECEEVSNPMEVIELLDSQLTKKGKLRQPFDHDCSGVKPGEKDERGLFTHPNPLFTAVNHNGRKLAIEADASASPQGGMVYFQDWRDAQEIKDAGWLITSVWDGETGRFWTIPEIAEQFPHNSKN